MENRRKNNKFKELIKLQTIQALPLFNLLKIKKSNWKIPNKTNQTQIKNNNNKYWKNKMKLKMNLII